MNNKSCPAKKFRGGSYLLIILGLAAAVLLLSKFVHLLYPPPAVPLFEPAAGLRAFTTADAAAKAGVPLSLPTQTYGVELFSAAQYVSASPLYPAGSTDAVYASNGARVFDVLRLPVPATDPHVRALAVGTPGNTLKVGAADGQLFLTPQTDPVCLDATPNRPLRVCQLGERLVFGDDHATFIVIVDGHALTEGQLIEVARSIAP